MRRSDAPAVIVARVSTTLRRIAEAVEADARRCYSFSIEREVDVTHEVTAPGAGRPLALRVTVTDAWQVVPLSLPPHAPVAELKRRALEAAGISAARAAQYEVKVGGALVHDEAVRLDAAGVPDGAGLVVLPRRRRAVR